MNPLCGDTTTGTGPFDEPRKYVGMNCRDARRLKFEEGIAEIDADLVWAYEPQNLIWGCEFHAVTRVLSN